MNCVKSVFLILTFSFLFTYSQSDLIHIGNDSSKTLLQIKPTVLLGYPFCAGKLFENQRIGICNSSFTFPKIVFRNLFVVSFELKGNAYYLYNSSCFTGIITPEINFSRGLFKISRFIVAYAKTGAGFSGLYRKNNNPINGINYFFQFNFVTRKRIGYFIDLTFFQGKNITNIDNINFYFVDFGVMFLIGNSKYFSGHLW